MNWTLQMGLHSVLCLSAAVISTNTLLSQVMGTATSPRCSPLRIRGGEGFGTMAVRWRDFRKDDRSRKPVVEGIGATINPPTVRREVVRISTVVQGT